MDNHITTWRQGRFIDSRRYLKWTDEQKKEAEMDERRRVRPSPTGNAICVCGDSDQAAWIVERLNLAARLEEMAEDFALGKENGEAIKELIRQRSAGQKS